MVYKSPITHPLTESCRHRHPSKNAVKLRDNSTSLLYSTPKSVSSRNRVNEEIGYSWSWSYFIWFDCITWGTYTNNEIQMEKEVHAFHKLVIYKLLVFPEQAQRTNTGNFVCEEWNRSKPLQSKRISRNQKNRSRVGQFLVLRHLWFRGIRPARGKRCSEKYGRPMYLLKFRSHMFVSPSEC
jgi:hypothetical protein